MVAEALNIPPLVGPFVFCAVRMALAAVLVLPLMRPDPLLLSHQLETDQAMIRAAAADSPGPDSDVPSATVWSIVWHVRWRRR
ncbi:MAG: hypothetical protein M3381_15195 [Actinomycetota bacterium]|nr:hypothetical protein [Actinomycetota bacterium]